VRSPCAQAFDESVAASLTAMVVGQHAVRDAVV
jgi:hypothetical protein